MRVIIILLVCCFALSSCTTMTEQEKRTQSLNQFLDKSYEDFLSENPMYLTIRGRKERYGELNDYSEAFLQRMLAKRKAHLAKLMGFSREGLTPQGQISYDMYKKELEDGITDYKWRDHDYMVTKMFGVHTRIPVFLMNNHLVKSEQDIKDYISRLNEVKRVMSQVVKRLSSSQEKGVLMPRFTYPDVITVTKEIIVGAPFEKGQKDSPMYADFKKKLSSLKLSEEKSASYLQSAERAFLESVKPGYMQLYKKLKAQSKMANNKDGVWKHPRGREFYETQLKRHTTTEMTAEQIHQLGLKEVARLRTEMLKVARKLKHKGNLSSFFKKVRKDKTLYFSNDKKGAEAYLKMIRGMYAHVKAEVPNYFYRFPNANFEIRAVEKFREKSAGTAFYEYPSEDGSRPGIYYVNTYNMHNLPRYEAAAIMYHEGAPGHHFQIATSLEIQGVPKTRKFADYGSYLEGWALYAERLAKEMGGYQDLYSELGRLSAEMLRASRLVVDTGIHAKKWSRTKAIRYFNQNLPATEEENRNQIDRYIIWPGQATSYMIGMLKIYDLREKAKAKLKNNFDVRGFHQVVLGSGAVPLDVLEKLVENYVTEKLTSKTQSSVSKN